MRLLLLTAVRPQTGNVTTARRIQEHLEAANHTCVLKDAFGYESPSAITKLISSENFAAALGIHLYKAGRLLRGCGIPFGIVFGGTDINEDVKCDKKYRMMEAVLEEARFAVSFTEDMKESAAAHWPHLRNKIYIQHQGIVTSPNVSFNWQKFLQNAGIHQGKDDLRLFLLICGLRKVKDPLYVVDAFTEWHQEVPDVHLIIIGPAYVDPTTPPLSIPVILNRQVDPVFAEEVKESVNRADGVHLLRAISQEDLHAAVKNCFAVVNSSSSEGMSAAVLEAMDLNVPVLARNVPGNAAVITHLVTGLLYSNPKEFVQLSKRLISDPSLRRGIITRAKEYVEMHHSWERERKAYQELMLRLQ